MSWKACDYVVSVLTRKHDWLNTTHIAILLAIATRHHQDDHCAWGQLQRLSEDTHAGISTLSRLIGELEDRGVLAVWEGYLPRRKGEDADSRRRRSLLFTFPGLDPEQGPPYDNVQRHIRHGGAGTHAGDESVADAATDFSAEQGEPVAPEVTQELHVDGTDELQTSATPELLDEQLALIGIPAGIPAGTRPGPDEVRTKGPAPPVPPASGWGGNGANGVAVAPSPANVALRRQCPDCQQLVGAITAKGHAQGCWRFGLASSHEWFLRPRAEIEADLERRKDDTP